MAGTFVDELVRMHDDELSLPSIAVALDRHLALAGPDHAAERQRLAAAFAAQRSQTVLSEEILQLIRGSTG